MPVKISQRTSMPGVHAASQAVSTRVLDDIEDRLGNVDEAEIPVVTQENRLIPIFAYVLTLLGGKRGIPAWAWIFSANNMVSHSKRAVSTAMIVSFGGIGGIFATTVFRQADFPRYLMGIYATIAFPPWTVDSGLDPSYFQKLSVIFSPIISRSQQSSYKTCSRSHCPLGSPSLSSDNPSRLLSRRPMSTTDRGNYSDSDLKDVSKESSLDFAKFENHDGKDSDEERFEKKTMLWVDFRILPLLAFIYSFCLIDRINMGAAVTAGMGVDLKLLVDQRYNIASMIYFVPYVIFQLPGNLVLRILGPRHWLTFSVLAWGAVQLGMGFVKDWGQLAATRALMGFFEAPFFPAMVFLISTWYKRHEVQTRMAIFYLISLTMGGISPILAWAISKLNGRQNLAGWRWIFIVEGAFTLFLGVIAWFFIPEFPHQNRFLTEKQTQVVLKRIEQDRGDSIPDPLTREKVFTHLKDWTIWAYGVMFFCVTMPAYSQAYFISIILKGMGWSQTKALLLSAPPYGPPILTVLVFSWLSDRLRHRSGFIILNTLICIAGLCLTAFAKQNEVRYFGTFLTNIGNGGAAPGILAYSSNNVVSHSKRTVQSAVTVMLAGLSGIVATLVFRTQDAPRYIPGITTTVVSQGLLILTVLITSTHFWRLNKLSRQGKLSQPLEGQPGFLYTL
ncbi:hypothetical protein D9756_005469 [Leucocoprinus leucothites]|uniref:Major facilitator superfamily (MFS) profile domain-containing protein n=1 Tax=Leucocoprinus leucothites TaxID=201217 RepID=A0A8H5FZF7_9AGAR|nr:hypothetical protein D9756_005469 [Leucoagaricus leucothites]